MTPAQRRILVALLDAGGAASAGAVAAAVGVHVTTARFHLERMVADGMVAIRPEPVEASGGGDGGVRRGRGRPRMHYVALTIPTGDAAGLSDPAHAVFEVSRALGFQPRLEVDGDAAATLARRTEPDGHGDDGDDGAQSSAAFTLTACPYRSGTGTVPVEVCRAHEDLLQRTADLAAAGSATGASGQGASSSSSKVRLLPLVTPKTCTLLVG